MVTSGATVVLRGVSSNLRQAFYQGSRYRPHHLLAYFDNVGRFVDDGLHESRGGKLRGDDRGPGSVRRGRGRIGRGLVIRRTDVRLAHEELESISTILSLRVSYSQH